jgi:sodium-dependent dicarboxylate transporter 2/3/5
MNAARRYGIITAVVIAALILLFVDLDPANYQVTIMAAVAVLMAILWITEAIPLAATSLIPFILFPVFGLLTSSEIA